MQKEYTPVKEDFAFLPRRDLFTDTNFASQSYWKGVLIHFFKNRRAVIGLVIITLIIIFAIIGPSMNEFGYRDIVQYRNANNKRVVAKGIEPQIPALHKLFTGEEPEGNFSEYTFLFGTDDMGRDLWTRTWYGARVSLLIAFVTIFIDMIIGMSYGLISGYFGGKTDIIMQRFVEIANSVPRLVIVSVLAIFMAKGMGLVIVALLLTEWIGMSKIARAEMLKTPGDPAQYDRADHHAGHVLHSNSHLYRGISQLCRGRHRTAPVLGRHADRGRFQQYHHPSVSDPAADYRAGAPDAGLQLYRRRPPGSACSQAGRHVRRLRI